MCSLSLRQQQREETIKYSLKCSELLCFVTVYHTPDSTFSQWGSERCVSLYFLKLHPSDVNLMKRGFTVWGRRDRQIIRERNNEVSHFREGLRRNGYPLHPLQTDRFKYFSMSSLGTKAVNHAGVSWQVNVSSWCPYPWFILQFLKTILTLNSGAKYVPELKRLILQEDLLYRTRGPILRNAAQVFVLVSARCSSHLPVLRCVV